MEDLDPTGGKRKIAVAAAVAVLIIGTIKIVLLFATKPPDRHGAAADGEAAKAGVDELLRDGVGGPITPNDRAVAAATVEAFARFAPPSTTVCIDAGPVSARALIVLGPAPFRPDVRIEAPIGPPDLVSCLQERLEAQLYPAVDAVFGVRVKFVVE